MPVWSFSGRWFTVSFSSHDRHIGHWILTGSTPKGKPQNSLRFFQHTNLWSMDWLRSNLLLITVTVCAGCSGHRQPEGHVDAVQRNPIPVEEGQTRLCKFRNKTLTVLKAKHLFILIWLSTRCCTILFCCFLFPTFVQVVWLCTCIASTLLGLDLGLAVGLGVELISVVLRTQLYVSGHQHSVYKKLFLFAISCQFLSNLDRL